MGVCGGLAEYFKVDPSIVRIIAIILLFSGSLGFWLYIILGIILPYDYQINPNSKSYFDSAMRGSNMDKNRKDVTPEKNQRGWDDF